MEYRKRLDKIMDTMGRIEPELENREDLMRNVMESVSVSTENSGVKRILDLAFSWTDILWIRRGLATVSIVLVFVFVFQQFTIISRIDQLEIRMVESNTEQIIRQQGENVLLNSVLMEEVSDTEYSDSIKVADRDLRDLVDSYTELQRRYQELRNKRYSKQVIGNSNNNQEL